MIADATIPAAEGIDVATIGQVRGAGRDGRSTLRYLQTDESLNSGIRPFDGRNRWADPGLQGRIHQSGRPHCSRSGLLTHSGTEHILVSVPRLECPGSEGGKRVRE